MITFVRTLEISQGKGKEATEWLLKAAKLFKEHYPETNLQVMRNVGGKANQLHWVDTHESLGAWEEMSKKVEANADLRALFVEGEGLFVDSSNVVSFYETIS